MNTSRMRTHAPLGRMVSWVTAVAAAAVLTSVTTGGSAAAAMPPNGAHFADSVTQASIVLIQVNWRGWLVVTNDVKLSSTVLPKGRYGPYKAVTSCSGFVVSPSGDIVTAGHCVDGSSFYGGKGAILAAAAASGAYPNGTHLALAQIADWEKAVDANARVEGDQTGSPVDRAVKVSIPSGSAGTAVFTGWKAVDVVDVQPFTHGDLALLKAADLAAPVLPLAHATPIRGASIVAVGYPGSTAEVVYPTTPASFLKGTVTGTQTVNGISFSQISPQASADMSGGPVLNMAGQVVGTLSWPPSQTTSGSSMTSVGSIWSMLATNEVNYPPSNGLPWDFWLAIGLVALVLAVSAGIFLIKRPFRKPPATPSEPPTGGLPPIVSDEPPTEGLPPIESQVPRPRESVDATDKPKVSPPQGAADLS